MFAVLSALVLGLFSLAVIWYQNYLEFESIVNNQNGAASSARGSLKNNNNEAEEEVLEINTYRFVCTILIAVFPSFIFFFSADGNPGLFLNEMFLFITASLSLWALLMGWQLKTLFEKIILILSLSFSLLLGTILLIEN